MLQRAAAIIRRMGSVRYLFIVSIARIVRIVKNAMFMSTNEYFVEPSHLRVNTVLINKGIVAVKNSVNIVGSEMELKQFHPYFVENMELTICLLED